MRAAKAAMVTEFLQAKEQTASTMWYDADNGKMVAQNTLTDGYNKAKQNNIDADGAVVEVVITLKSGTDEVNEVTATWVAKKGTN